MTDSVWTYERSDKHVVLQDGVFFAEVDGWRDAVELTDALNGAPNRGVWLGPEEAMAVLSLLRDHDTRHDYCSFFNSDQSQEVRETIEEQLERQRFIQECIAKAQRKEQPE